MVLLTKTNLMANPWVSERRDSPGVRTQGGKLLWPFLEITDQIVAAENKMVTNFSALFSLEGMIWVPQPMKLTLNRVRRSEALPQAFTSWNTPSRLTPMLRKTQIIQGGHRQVVPGNNPHSAWPWHPLSPGGWQMSDKATHHKLPPATWVFPGESHTRQDRPALLCSHLNS